MQRTPAGLPFGMPGIGEEMEGAMQQAPQLGLQENFVMAPVYSKHHSKHRQPQSTRLDHVCISPLQYDPTDSFESIYSVYIEKGTICRNPNQCISLGP